MTLRLGFFTRLLDDTTAAERYRLGAEQIVHAERCGFDSAWIAQHHFHENEGGLPAPFVFLGHVAARTRRIRLGTGIVTLPLEMPLRVAEDAAVLDLMSGERLELGIGPGGNASAFIAFGLDGTERGRIFGENTQRLKEALAGKTVAGGDHLYPAAPASLLDRMWQATFTVDGARRAGAAGDGLLLSRTQPRPKDQPGLTLAEIQNPMIDAYLEALPDGRAPRILASRSVFVTDERADAFRFAEIGLQRFSARLISLGRAQGGETTETLIAALDVHLGTAEDVVASLKADSTLARATDLAVQVHSIDPPHPFILRSIELVAEKVAPEFGWHRETTEGLRHVA